MSCILHYCFLPQAQAPDDLSVRRGDWIYADLQNQTVDGWLWAYAPKTRKYGFIPKAFLGRLSHSYFSHGDFVKVISRNSNHELGLSVVQSGWESSLFVTFDMYNELFICKEYYETFNGQSIQKEEMKFEVISPNQISYILDSVDPKDVNLPRHVFVSGN